MDIDSTSNSVVKKQYLLKAVLSNFQIVHNCSNRSQLLFLEVLYVKMLAPNINDGLKAFLTIDSI